MKMNNKTFYYLTLFLLTSVNAESTDLKHVTQTVYGFLDFITTIGNTIMVFSPESAPTLELKENNLESIKVIETKPIKSGSKTVHVDISPTKLVIVNSTKSEITKIAEKKNNFSTNSEVSVSGVYFESNLNKPEYNLLSRQPTEYIEERYRLVNIHSNASVNVKNRSKYAVEVYTKDFSMENLPVPKDALITKQNSIGSYMFSKNSHEYKNIKSKTVLSSTPRILKTISISSKYLKEDLIKSSTTNSNVIQIQSGFSKRHRTKNSRSISATIDQKNNKRMPTQDNSKKALLHNKSKSRRNKQSRRPGNKNVPHLSSSATVEKTNRRLLAQRIDKSGAESGTSSSLYIFKLNRAPGRWQYKASPKPKVNIRKPVPETSLKTLYPLNITTSITDQIKIIKTGQDLILDNMELESSGTQNELVLNNAGAADNHKYVVETLNVEISTPDNFKDTYYEIATIKTPYIFQAGVIKKTRFITITSTYEKTLEPELTSTIFEGPLTENILNSSPKSEKLLLDGSIVTLLPIYLADSEETPSLGTITESYTLTQIKLGTLVLPIVRDGENVTSYITAIQTYDIKKLITVTKTLLPGDTNQFIPSISLKDININLDSAGSEINLDLDFGDEQNSQFVLEDGLRNLELDINKTTTKSYSTMPSTTNKKKMQLELVNIFNPTHQMPAVLTTSRPVIKQETIWESHVVPIKNGLSTSYRTLSKSMGIFEKTEYEIETVTIASILQPQMSANPYLLPVQQHYQTVSSPLVQQQIITEISSKVLKLTFGAKTAYTTLFSTYVLPKIITTFVITTLPVQPSVQFPGYFPPAYPPYTYVG